ncbi:hypothetical protein ACFODZ_02640 [Marinicella sediminis]|uniref:General secretion pathway protein GspN n=1 Tax=Marinicella sediminis TaxID=1792834 RepID=A0ABV7JAL3_9GAMM|nr:hypothetical protein [Marinicella sediminis]
MKNNAFSNGLMIVIGVLMVVAALQLMGWGQGTSSLEPEPFDVSQLSQLAATASQGQDVRDDDMLDTITGAPLFSISRTPFVPEEIDLVEGDDDPVEAAEPLKARVTSIMILGEAKYAMILDELTNEQVTLEMGMPLPGEQGLWVVDHIEPRKVVFSSEGEEPVELELDVFDGQLNASAAKAARPSSRTRDIQEEVAENSDATKQKNSAEEIRRKIAERRAQMRANAAKGNKNDN